MGLLEAKDYDNHELVQWTRDAESGLSFIIAVHNTALGPAAGGCRMWSYSHSGAALEDVLRLSRGMSYKNAMADLPFGGGKAVIMGDPRTEKSPEILTAFAKRIHGLGGLYVTAEDVGLAAEDMRHIAQYTPYVTGFPKEGVSRVSGDPSPRTAYGVFYGLQAAVRYAMDRSDLEGLRVAVQGVGAVGRNLCKLLAEEGARLTVADTYQPAVDYCRETFGADAADPEAIHALDVDVFAPCALGAGLNARTIPEIQAKVIAGAANNQLAEPGDGQQLRSRGITYAPDYVVNAGGIINVAAEYFGDMTEEMVVAKVEGIEGRLWEILERADLENRSTDEIADHMAREKISRGRTAGRQDMSI